MFIIITNMSINKSEICIKVDIKRPFPYTSVCGVLLLDLHPLYLHKKLSLLGDREKCHKYCFLNDTMMSKRTLLLD